MGPTARLAAFCLVAVSAGWLGFALEQGAGPEAEGLGMLVFLVLPLVVGLLLRAVGDGFDDAGLKPSGVREALLGMGIAPARVLVALAVALPLGFATLDASAVALGGALIAGTLVKNLFEEGAWRGYLAPRAFALLSDGWAHALAALVWFAWHLPMWLVFTPPEVLAGWSSQPLAVFILQSAVGIAALSVFYNELRLRCASIWPVVLAHTTDNIAAASLLQDGALSFEPAAADVIFSPGPHGLIAILAHGAAGLWLWRTRVRQASS